MDRVEEIEAAITNLPVDEYRGLVGWFRAREQTRWDEQLDRDSITSKVDFLFPDAEEERERERGRVRDWPSTK